MKLPQIKRATWEKIGYPDAKWVFIERRYNTYIVSPNFRGALKMLWFWVIAEIKRKNEQTIHGN